MVECDLAKVEVAGSNPVSRSLKDEGGGMKDEVEESLNDSVDAVSFSSHIPPPSSLFPSGGVAKW